MELLIADPSQSFAKALERRLAGSFAIFHCTDGEEALQMLAQRQPDILLLHTALPRKDGLTLLLQTTYRPETILVMTNFLDERLAQRLYSLGAGHILVQPAVNTVAVWLMELLNRRGSLLPRERFAQQLQSLGFSTTHAGYPQLLQALELLKNDPKQSLSGKIYPAVGKGAEKNIRDAIAAARRKGDRQVWHQQFPAGCPSNRVFLLTLLQTDRDGETEAHGSLCDSTV